MATERAIIEAKDREYQKQQEEIERQQKMMATEVGIEAGAGLLEWVGGLDPWPGFIVATIITLVCIFVIPAIFPPAALITIILSVIFGLLAVIDFFRGIYQIFCFIFD